jgi:DNA-binding transcriptional LysR family regulator
MADDLTLTQLRTFIAAAEEGSFSAAGRKLGRAQSVVSQILSGLESQLAVKLFDRSRRYPKLTAAGQSLLLEARIAADSVDGFKASARALRAGLEPELAVVVDVVYPMDALTRVVGLFRAKFPRTALRLYVEALGGVIQPVLDGQCRLGIVGTLPTVPEQVSSKFLLSVPFVSVVSPVHPFAQYRGIIPRAVVAQHTQLVLTDRTSLSDGRNFGVLSPQTWRLADLGAKLAFLRAGFGWGQMPAFMVKTDLQQGTLVKVRIEGLEPRLQLLPMHAIYRKDAPLGPAARAFLEWLTVRDGKS